MKTLVMVLLATVLMAGNIFAQAAPQPAQGIAFGLVPGQDNAYLFSPGDKAGFFAVGLGIDVASYTKKLSPGGSTVALYLHGTALTPVSGDTKTPIFGASINCDILQLLTGTKVKILIPQLSLLAGPLAAYDVFRGRLAYGGLVNFNYKF